MTDINKIVSVVIGTAPTFPAKQGFSDTLIVGSSTSLPIGSRFRFYGDLTAVGVDFAAGTEEYKAATKYFSQSPAPARVAIGRRFAAAVAAELLSGGGITNVLATYQAITTGSFAITIDGVVRQVTALDFSAAASMNAIAAVIQTRLVAVNAASTCVYLANGNMFKLTSGTTGGASTITFARAPAAGADVSVLLGLDATSGGIVTAGSAIESITASLNALQIINPGWYAMALTAEALQADLIEAAAWIEANVKVQGATSSNANNKDSTSVTSLGYLLKAAGYRRTLAVYSSTDPYAALSALARAATVNFDQPDSTITLKFKVLPGITVEALTETERLALEGNSMNYYTVFGGVPMLAEGVMSDGTFFDEVQGLDWLRVEIETDVFGYLYTRATKVPQTDRGVATIVQQVEKAFEKGVSNGLLAAGQWDGADLGTIKSGAFLPKGFYVHAGKVADQSTGDRVARKTPPISAIALGAGALHSVAIGVTFVR